MKNKTIKMIAIGKTKEGKTIYLSETTIKRLEQETQSLDKPNRKV